VSTKIRFEVEVGHDDSTDTDVAEGRRAVDAALLVVADTGHPVSWSSAPVAPDLTRPPFPDTEYQDCCPSCGADDRSLQLSEETTRYWRGFQLHEDGTLFVYDEATSDDGDDAHISCLVCLTEWSVVPEDIEYG
jgi:hypothetical protein